MPADLPVPGTDSIIVRSSDRIPYKVVSNLAPVAVPGGPYSGTAGVALAFNGLASYDFDGMIAAYDWDFGDGGTDTGANPSYTYAAAGEYTVTLTVTDDEGAKDISQTTATITLNAPPVADPGGPYSGVVGVPVAFDGQASSDSDGTIDLYAWDFGDGTPPVTGATASHVYTAAGEYTVTFGVLDDAGATDIATTTAIIAANSPPVAVPDGPYLGTVGVPVAFDGQASFDLDGTIVAYYWDFADGGTYTGPTPSHIYLAAGEYDVTLRVTDDHGATHSSTTKAFIAQAPPVADAGGPYSGTAGVPVEFDGTASSDLDGEIEAYDWEFGDGSPTGTDPTPSHMYAAAGTYTVTLVVRDNDGALDIATTTATIEPASPVAIPDGPYSGTVGVPVAFDGLASFDLDGMILAYVWDFGDGGTYTGQTTTHTFLAPGVYTVTLWVLDDDGTADIATTTATISP